MSSIFSEGGFALYKESDEKCFVRAMLVHIHVKVVWTVELTNRLYTIWQVGMQDHKEWTCLF